VAAVPRRMVRRRAMEAVAVTAAAAAVISAAAPARGGISGSHRPQTAARASLAHRVILYVATPSAGPPGTVTPINTPTHPNLPPAAACHQATAAAGLLPARSPRGTTPPTSPAPPTGGAR